jgi:hypothetical protein
MRKAIVNGRTGVVAAAGTDNTVTAGKVFVLFDDERESYDPSANWFDESVVVPSVDELMDLIDGK